LQLTWKEASGKAPLKKAQDAAGITTAAPRFAGQLGQGTTG
jgi:hypothetical protein